MLEWMMWSLTVCIADSKTKYTSIQYVQMHTHSHKGPVVTVNTGSAN